MTTSIKDFNLGGYVQVGGTSVTITLGSDGFTLGLGGQLSVGYTVSGAENINYSLSNGWAIQHSVLQGLGTPTGMPGISVSVMRGLDTPTTQLQVGLGLNDLLEGGLTGSVTTNPIEGFSYSNEGRNYKTQTYNFGPNYRGYGFTDPRILDTSESYRSLNPTNSASINQTSQTSSSGGSGGAWNTIGGGTSGFGGSTVQPGSMTNTAPNQGPGYPTPTVTQSSGGSGGSGGGGNSGFGGSKVQPGSATNTAPNQGPGWAPIVIDLDGDGVEIKPLSRSSTTFDADSDGYKERSAWAGADDGLLVIDLNGDGQVTQSKEIAFSEWTAEQDTDLQALAKVFDSNGDGTFDSRDARFSEFRIWKDANSNGVVDAGEVMTLQEAGIAANDVNYRRCA